MLFYLILYLPTWISYCLTQQGGCGGGREWEPELYVKDCLWTSGLKLIGEMHDYTWECWSEKRKILNLRRGLVIWKPSGFFLLILCMTFLVPKSIPFLSGRLTAQPQALQFVNSDTFSESRAMGLRLLWAGKT